MIISLLLIALCYYVYFRTSFLSYIIEFEVTIGGWTFTSLSLFYGFIILIGILCLIFGTRQIMKFPIFAGLISFTICELIVYIILRYTIKLLESLFIRPNMKSNAQDYKEWETYALETDKILHRNEWKARPNSKYFNMNLTLKFHAELHNCLTKNDYAGVLELLGMCINKSMNGILNEHLYSKTAVGTKYLIDNYIETIVNSVTTLAEKVENGEIQSDKQLHNNNTNGYSNHNNITKIHNITHVHLLSQTGSSRRGSFSHLNAMALEEIRHLESDPDEKQSDSESSMDSLVNSNHINNHPPNGRNQSDTRRVTRRSSLAAASDQESNNNHDNHTNGNNRNGRTVGRLSKADLRSERSPTPRRNRKKASLLHDIKSTADYTNKANGTSSSSNSSSNIVNNLSNQASGYSNLQPSFGSNGSSSDPQISAEYLLSQLKQIKSHYGNTALCLSGGASLGHYHWGVVLALLKSGYLPKVISGTSSGAVVAATICTRTDEELESTLQPEVISEHFDCFDRPWLDRIKSYFTNKCMFDRDEWLNKLQWFANGLTFLEAYKKTGRILNITATSASKHEAPILLNYLSSPNVTIASAVLASAAVPGLINPVYLIEKILDKRNGTATYRPLHGEGLKFRDGSFESDVPLIPLSELFGCSFYFVSQTNPHIIPFFFNARGQSGGPSGWRIRGGGYRGGFILSFIELFLKEDMKKNLRVLGQLDLLPAALGQDWSFLFLQEFQGQITFVPNATIMDYVRLISDVSADQIRRYIQEGRISAWKKFSMIKNREDIRITIEKAIEKIETVLNKSKKYM